MNTINITNQSSIETARERYKAWSAGMKQKFAGETNAFLLLGKDTFSLTSDGRFTNPIHYSGLPFRCVEVAYKFAKYYSAQESANKQSNIFFSACKDQDSTGQKIRNLERALSQHLTPTKSWLVDTQYKLDIMNELMTQKFQNNSDLLEILKQTGNREIIAPSFCVSGNGMPWGDRVYEIEFDENYEQIGGENIHGKILIEIRNKL
jgi:predicted NAD-dependent protein-ADP-ribosyltransferase YbiA (DUF1768 family)